VTGALRVALLVVTVATLVAAPRPALAEEPPADARDAAAAEAAGPPDARSDPDAEEPAMPMLAPVLVTAPRASDAPLGSSTLDEQELAEPRAASSDSARLLEDVPGVSLYRAGGVSSLPAIRGLADDRVRVQVDGVDAVSACPNHMNPALSYVAPRQVARATVFAGIAPVSAGGDSIGGTIQVESAPPAFAEAAGELRVEGQAGGYFRSNGTAWGYDLAASVASEALALSYDESQAESDNYHAASGFKPGAIGSILPGGEWIDADVVGSSAYDDVINRSLEIAARREGHLLELEAGMQTLGFEGFPNQRMDMTGNTNLQLRIAYTGSYEWGELETRLSLQDTRHDMNMGPDRFAYGFGMPMKTKASAIGGLVAGNLVLSERDTLRLGADYQLYDLDDWWPPAGQAGAMAPNAFRNIENGERDRFGIFAEWEAIWSPEWISLVGLRGDRVASDAGAVRGYNDSMGIWTADAAAFNARDRERRDHHLGFAALLRWLPIETLTLEAAVARQTRSPSLYERYPWSTNAMAALMNNSAGDGNGYIGNVALRPEVAHTVGATLDWHPAAGDEWGMRATAYLSYVDDFIDARRCDFGQCSASNATTRTGFVLLQYVNRSARLWGVDLSAHRLLGSFDRYGSFTATARLGYVRGENRSTGDDLYHVMPLHGKLGLVHRLGAWTTRLDLSLVDDKTRVSGVRNEVPTAGYSLLDLRSSYEWKHVRVDVGVENLLDEFYELPLGGAYLGQGASMSTLGIPWGVTVPGRGRSFEVALTLKL